MGKHKIPKPRPRARDRRVVVVLAAAIVLALGGGAYWWGAESPEPVGGTPRLVLDREVIDVCDVAFETPVNAVFTLKNTGAGVLLLADVPRVKVLAGC